MNVAARPSATTPIYTATAATTQNEDFELSTTLCFIKRKGPVGFERMNVILPIYSNRPSTSVRGHDGHIGVGKQSKDPNDKSYICLSIYEATVGK